MSKVRTILFTPAGCLSLDAVYRYQSGELEHEDSRAVEKHLADCELCNAAIDLSQGTDRETVKKIASTVNKSIGKSPGSDSVIAVLIADYGKWAAAAAAVLIFGYLLFLSLPEKKHQVAETPVQQQEPAPPETLALNQPAAPVDSAPAALSSDTIQSKYFPIEPINDTIDIASAQKEKAEQDKKEDEEKKKAEKEKKEKEKKEREKKKKEAEKEASEPASQQPAVLITSVEITDKYVISEAKVSDVTTAKRKRKKNSDPAFAAGVDSSGRPPEFEGGDERLKQYVKDNINLPPDYSGEKGIAVVNFTVNHDGKISDVNVQKGLSETVDRELMRVVRSIPDWKPGEPGKSSKVKVNIYVKVGE